MKMFTNYTAKKTCPHIQRVHGNEISLMTEIVSDNETKNLFPAPVKTLKKGTRDLTMTK